MMENKRPKQLLPEQSDKIAREAANEIKKNRWSSSDIEIIVQDLKKLDYNNEPYAIAKQLENDGRGSYNFNMMMLEQLDCIADEIRDAIEENVKAWVKGCNIKARFNLNDKLLVKDDINSALPKDAVVYFTGGKAELAHYYLSYGKDNKDSGYIVPFEVAHERCEVIE